MNSLEVEFFDEYKNVDSICKDMYSTEQGIGSYLEYMEKTPYTTRFKVVTWDDDYRKLKRMRWLRNQIAHENFCHDVKPEDLEWIRKFHNRLIIQDDSLAIAYKLKREETKCKSLNKQNEVRESINIDMHGSKKESSYTALIIISIIVAVGLIAGGIYVLTRFFPFVF